LKLSPDEKENKREGFAMMQTLRENLYFVLLIAAWALAQPNITGLSFPRRRAAAAC
jgi:hypothetical protein